MKFIKLTDFLIIREDQIISIRKKTEDHPVTKVSGSLIYVTLLPAKRLFGYHVDQEMGWFYDSREERDAAFENIYKQLNGEA